MTLLIIGSSYAQDTISALFIGNSYTYVNDLPTMVKLIAQSKGDVLTVDSKSNGGFTFQNHWNDPLTYQKMKSRNWDFVVLQGQSQEPAFPYQQVTNSTLPYAKRLADSVYQLLSCSQVNFFMTWGRENGDPQWDSINTFEKMNERLKLAYLRFTKETQSSVSPVAEVWRLMRLHYPTVNLYSGDGSHPSVAGSYVAACTFYASLFRKSVAGATYLAGLDPQIATAIQALADQVVLGNLSSWSLRPKHKRTLAFFDVVQNMNQIACTNVSWLATSYAWNFGDGNTSSETNPGHTYTASGDYTLELIASSVCGSDTAFTVVSVPEGMLGLGENYTEVIRVLVAADHVLTIEGNGITEIGVFTVDGRRLAGTVNRPNDSTLQLSLPTAVSGKIILRLMQHGHPITQTIWLY